MSRLSSYWISILSDSTTIWYLKQSNISNTHAQSNVPWNLGYFETHSQLNRWIFFSEIHLAVVRISFLLEKLLLCCALCCHRTGNCFSRSQLLRVSCIVFYSSPDSPSSPVGDFPPSYNSVQTPDRTADGAVSVHPLRLGPGGTTRRGLSVEGDLEEQILQNENRATWQGPVAYRE